VEFDDTTGTSGQRGSGVLRLQDTTAFAQNKITGPYAFGFEGQDAAGNHEAIIGSFHTDGAGAIPNGVADQNIAGTANKPNLTGSYTAPSINNGRATMKLNFSSAVALDLIAYVLSPNEILVMTSNVFASAGLLSGTLVSQSSMTIDNSSECTLRLLPTRVSPSAPQRSRSRRSPKLRRSGGITATTIEHRGRLKERSDFTATYAVQSGGRVPSAAGTA
jgi:hypothetical protein